MYVLQTDASGKGISGVLSVCRDGEELPVDFFSRQLWAAETRYAATELEYLAVVCSIHHFAVYLTRHPFTVQIEHKALEHLLTSTHPNGRLTRWALSLQPYTFNIGQRPGSQKHNADEFT